MKSTEIKPTDLRAERLQTRAATDAAYVDELAERMTAGDIFPPITIFTDSKNSWVSDGIHRLDAAIKANTKIGVDYRQGTRSDAIEFACGANASHGLRRSNADKRRAVTLALSEFPNRSSRAIAELCGVGHTFVDDVRSTHQLASDASSVGRTPSSSDAERRVGRDGRQRSLPPKDELPAEQSKISEAEITAVNADTLAERQWGDGDSLEDVQADIKEALRRCDGLKRFIRLVLRCKENEVTRPYCANYSLLTVAHPIGHVSRVLDNDMPDGGTPDKPVLKHENKALKVGA